MEVDVNVLVEIAFDLNDVVKMRVEIAREKRSIQTDLVVVPYPMPLLIYPTEKTVKNSTKVKENKATALLSMESENSSTLSTAPVYVEDDDKIRSINRKNVHLISSNHKYSDLNDFNKNKFLIGRINENYRPTKNAVNSYNKQFNEDRNKYEVIPLPNKLAIEVLKGLQKYNDLKLK